VNTRKRLGQDGRNVGIQFGVAGMIDLGYAAGGGEDLGRAEVSPNREHHQFTGTRRFSSSDQFCTITT
jgi:hypothetical protein